MTQDNSSAQLVERLRELLKKATPRPWIAGTGGGGGATTYVYEDDGTGQQCRAVAACTLDFVTRNFDEREANAQLIAESINALPDLIEALTRPQPPTSSVEAVARAELLEWASQHSNVTPLDGRIETVRPSATSVQLSPPFPQFTILFWTPLTRLGLMLVGRRPK